MIDEDLKKKIRDHLRRPENDEGIAEIAKSMATEFQKRGGEVTPEVAEKTAYIMNIGETDERISYIYESDYKWNEHPDAIELNKLHGEYSVKMAEKMGIPLTDEQKETIEGHSRGEYNSNLAYIMKVAEMIKATESERWYRGEKKQAAKSWEEVLSVLREDKNIPPRIIEMARISYGEKHFAKEPTAMEQPTI